MPVAVMTKSSSKVVTGQISHDKIYYGQMIKLLYLDQKEVTRFLKGYNTYHAIHEGIKTPKGINLVF
jgi:hypothetical protein